MNAIPAAYKRSEVGVIPEDWVVINAAAICDLVVDCKNRTPPVVDGGDFAVVRTPNVRNGRFVHEDLRFTDEESFRVWTARAIPQLGDILITREAPLGEVCLVPPNMRVCLGQRMMLYRVNCEKADSRFLLYALLSSRVQGNLLKKIGGSTVGHAKVDDIRNLQVPLPRTKAEQEAIAEALSDADALVDSLEQLLAKKRHLKQGAMQEMFFPRNGWVIKKLEEIADVIDPHPSHRAPPQVATGIPFVGIGDLNEEGEIIGKKLRNVDASVFEEHRSRYKVEENLIGLGRVASIGKVVRLKDVGVKYAVSPTLGVIRGTKVSRAYLLHALKSKFVTDQFTRIMSGSTRSSVGMVVLRRLEIPLPSKEEEQTAIATVLSEMDAEIADLEVQIAKSCAVKQGMMQKLLTGEIRLI